MRKAAIILAAVLTLPVSVAGAQEKGATPQDVVQKVKQAASYLAKEKEAGLATFKQKQSEYVWADTYVFVIDCVQKKNAAHPLNPKLIGMDLSSIKDPTGKVIGPLFCEDHGGKGYWVEYQWPKRARISRPASCPTSSRCRVRLIPLGLGPTTTRAALRTWRR